MKKKCGFFSFFLLLYSKINLFLGGGGWRVYSYTHCVLRAVYMHSYFGVIKFLKKTTNYYIDLLLFFLCKNM